MAIVECLEKTGFRSNANEFISLFFLKYMQVKKNVILNNIIKIFAVKTVEGLKMKSLGKREFVRLREEI